MLRDARLVILTRGAQSKHRKRFLEEFLMARSIASIGVHCILLLGVTAGASAQQDVRDESTARYPAAFFSSWSPLTAQDMLDRVPGLDSVGGFGPPGGGSFGGGGGGGFGPPGGFTGGPPGGFSGGGGGGRGLGAGNRGTEILINGKRTAGKNNSTGGQLSRISADQVDYIEIIRGTTGELDVRGSGQVVNVVLFDTFTTATLQYEFRANQADDNTVSPSGSLSYSGQRGGLNYQLSARASDNYFPNISKENSVLGDFSPNDIIRERSFTEGANSNISTNLDYEISGNSSVRFNALLGEGEGPTELVRTTIDLKKVPNVTTYQRENTPTETDNWELGGDYEYNTSRGDRFKVLFISNSNNRNSVRERFDLLGGGRERKNLFLDSDSTTKERIVRSSYTFDIFESQDIELGAERAQTILDSTLALGVFNPFGTPSANHGGLVPVPVANSNSTVEEMRYEPFAIHNWIINPRMSLESSILYEMSEISQSGDVSKKRDFDFLKPKVDFRYDVTPSIQLRGTIEKIVQQLTFSDFVASPDTQDTDASVQAGNANLRQEWYWNYQLNAEYRLPNNIGVLSSRIYYEDWHDRIERLDVSTSETNLQSANGNIGDGEKYGVDMNGSIRMRMIDMPNLLVTGSLTVEDSKITDPFLGIERRFLFSFRGRTNLGFRHDVPEWNLNYGGNYSNMFDGGRIRYDIDDIELSGGDPFWTVFVEWIGFNDITFRLDAQRIINNGEFCRERQRFVGRISSGILEEVEDQCNTSGSSVSLRINGTF